MIYRTIHDKENPYFLLNRSAAEDRNLSFKAVGIHTYLMSKPDNWTVNETDLARRHTEGTTAIRSGIKELKDHGYLATVPVRDEKGHFSHWETHVFEIPQSMEQVHDVGNPHTGEPTETETAPIVSNDLLKNKQTEEEEEKDPTSWTSARRPLTYKAGRKYPAQEATPDPAAALIVHMQGLIDQPRGLLKKYKQAAGVTVLGASDRQTITAWIDHYQAKQAAGMDRDLATRLAYAAIRDAEPAPVAPEPMTAAHLNAAPASNPWAAFAAD